MNEVDLQRHLKAGMNEQQIWNYKITDSQIGVKPFDIVANMGGIFVAIEAKLVKAEKLTDNKVLLSAASFKGREHQLRELREVAEQGGIGIVVVGYYQTCAPWNKYCFAVNVQNYEDSDTLRLPDVLRPMTVGIELLVQKGGGALGTRWWFQDGFTDRQI